MKRKKNVCFHRRRDSALSLVHKGKHFCSVVCFVVFFSRVFSFSKKLSWSRDGRKETHIVTSTFEVFKDMLTGFLLNQLVTIKIYQYKRENLQLKASPGKLDPLESELNKFRKKITGKPKEKFLMQEAGFLPLSFVFFESGKASLCRIRGIWSMKL